MFERVHDKIFNMIRSEYSFLNIDWESAKNAYKSRLLFYVLVMIVCTLVYLLTLIYVPSAEKYNLKIWFSFVALFNVFLVIVPWVYRNNEQFDEIVRNISDESRRELDGKVTKMRFSLYQEMFIQFLIPLLITYGEKKGIGELSIVLFVMITGKIIFDYYYYLFGKTMLNRLNMRGY